MKYVQIHELVSYPASNLNRDDLGRPKTVKIGDAMRLRISSQSLKRAWRISDQMTTEFNGSMGIRTNKLSNSIATALSLGKSLFDVIYGVDSEPTRKPVDKNKSKEYGNEIDEAMRAKKSKEGSENSNEEEKPKKTDKAEKSKQLIHYSRAELEKIDNLMEAISRGESQDCSNISFDDKYSVDIALFGRMIAGDAKSTCEAAVQVAHAFTVHRAVIEDDFFTAVDDLSATDDGTGAGHLDVFGFGSGLFYYYMCVDYELLVKNLGGNEVLANDVLKNLIRVSATVSPSGKQSSFASRAYASYILVEEGECQPRSLASAFLKPVRGEDMFFEAVKNIRTIRDNIDNAYGKCYNRCYEINVLEGKGDMSSLMDFLQ